MPNQQALRGIYAITDADLLADDTQLQTAAESAMRGGLKLLQYRDKTADPSKALRQARLLADLCLSYNCQLIINDDPELAKAANAAGVHLGQSDSNLIDARELLGKKAIIGSTCHNSIELASLAAQSGASYLAFGRFFPSLTKPQAPSACLDILKVASQFNLPLVAIGGIQPEHLPSLAKAGASMVAVVAGIFAQPCPKTAVETYRNIFEPTLSFTSYEANYDTLSRSV
ncbi:thiamine phosphate synthase [Marinospirillum insulare]|uniref:Thiamine-phosphate synthase n=1 Tax=Marinospirillum insulare TaxID=217169 RepID=A0ABQ5ZVM5_9GAMM|nr:thiamine phosphate synthase [Marinospirillum insulare]GLR64069.1 thiamine-phosphate synthase [Marinospirillum insulare]